MRYLFVVDDNDAVATDVFDDGDDCDGDATDTVDVVFPCFFNICLFVCLCNSLRYLIVY